MSPGRPLLLACALMLGATASHADSKKVEAKKHYDLGKAHYALKDWDKAIDEFKIAYDMFPDPVNLYNIAQAYRLKDDCAVAATYYARYQREEKNKRLRDSVTQVRKKMDDCASKQPTEPLPVPPSVAPTVGQPPPQQQPPQVPPPAPFAVGAAPQPMTHDNALRPVETPNLDPNRNRRILGYVMLGTGGVFFLGGIVGSLQVAGVEGKIEDCDNSDFGCSDKRYAELDDEKKRAQAGANAGYAIGITAAIFGGILYVVSRKPKQDSRMTVVPTRGGAALSWTF